MLNSFVYVFTGNCRFFHIYFVRICPIKLEIAVLYYLNYTFQNNDFQTSVTVTLAIKKPVKIYWQYSIGYYCNLYHLLIII